ncbi:MAG: alpha/beta hydrolase, partial [Kiritimatiellaeota bacterium]|nr:alpha/beta hydrolase [Kiritimatiellota bacterium]
FEEWGEVGIPFHFDLTIPQGYVCFHSSDPHPVWAQVTFTNSSGTTIIADSTNCPGMFMWTYGADVFYGNPISLPRSETWEDNTPSTVSVTFYPDGYDISYTTNCPVWYCFRDLPPEEEEEDCLCHCHRERDWCETCQVEYTSCPSTPHVCGPTSGGTNAPPVGGATTVNHGTMPVNVFYTFPEEYVTFFPTGYTCNHGGGSLGGGGMNGHHFCHCCVGHHFSGISQCCPCPAHNPPSGDNGNGTTNHLRLVDSYGIGTLTENNGVFSNLNVGDIVPPGAPVHVCTMSPSFQPGDCTLTFAYDNAAPGEKTIHTFTALSVYTLADYDDGDRKKGFANPPEPLIVPVGSSLSQCLFLCNEVNLPGQTLLTLCGEPGAIRLQKWDGTPLIEYGQTVTNPGTTWYYIEALSNGTATVNIEFQGTGIASDYTAFHSLPITVVPFRMFPDFDRDGKIDESDKARLVAQGNNIAFRFWINDDRDKGFWGGNSKEDAPQGAYTGEGTSSDDSDIRNRTRNCEDNIVNGVRDMVDFFPLRIDLPPKSHPMSPNLTYKLKHEDEALNFVYTPFTPNNVGGWFTTACNGTAHQDKFGPGRNSSPTNAPTHHVTDAGVWLDPGWLGGRDAWQESVVLMCEGRIASNKPLVLEIYEDNTLFSTAELKMQLSSVRNMFRYLNVRAEDPYFTDNDITSAVRGSWKTDLEAPSNLPDSYLTLSGETLKTLIWIHGMDWDEAETPAGHAEVFKRLYQAGSNARFIGVSWASNTGRRMGNPIVYANDVIGAFIAAKLVKDGLSGYLGGDTTIVAHSLGNMLVSSMIGDHSAEVGNYVMLNAAMPTEAYDGRAPANDPDRRNMTHPDWRAPQSDLLDDYSERIMSAGWSTLFSPDDLRSHVTWDGRFADVLNKPETKVWQFYSSGEEVLRQADGGITTSISGQDIAGYLFNWLPFINIPPDPDTVAGSKEYTWVYHEITKGRAPLRDRLLLPRHRNAGWRFNRHYDNAGGSRMSPADTDLILTADLIATPFFRHFDTDAHKNIGLWMQNNRWMYEPDGDYGIPEFLPTLPGQASHMEKMKVHAKLLAEMIPPLSSAAGGVRLRTFVDDDERQLAHRAKDLTDYRNLKLNLWDSANRPKKTDGQRNNKRWLHGDYKDAPYLLTHQLYERLKEITQGE